MHCESVLVGGLGVAHLDLRLPIGFGEMPLGFRDDLATREGSGFSPEFCVEPCHQHSVWIGIRKGVPAEMMMDHCVLASCSEIVKSRLQVTTFSRWGENASGIVVAAISATPRHWRGARCLSVGRCLEKKPML